MKTKSEFAKVRWGSFLFPLVLGAMLQATTAKAATLNVVVAGYFGGNSLSTGALLPVGSSADFGVFYSGSSFTSSSAIASALSSITTDSAMQSFRSANGWVSFGTVTVPTTNGNFRMLWDLNSASAGPGFGTEFNLNPTTGALNGINLVGKIPYVWIQTAGANTEYGVFVSNQAFANAGFGALTQVDLSDTGDSATGVRALFGSVNIDGSGITTQAIPEPVTAHLALAGFGLLSLFRKRKTTYKS
jgi:hypothetical protein